MNIQELRNMVERDIKLDDTQLDLESLKTPQLHNKYLNFYHDEVLLYKKQEADYSKLKKLKWEYYTGKMTEDDLESLGWEPFQLKILKQDVDLYIKSDEDIIKMKMKMEYFKQKVEYLESIVKIIQNRQWTIKAAIDWRKFISGS